MILKIRVGTYLHRSKIVKQFNLFTFIHLRLNITKIVAHHVSTRVKIKQNYFNLLFNWIKRWRLTKMSLLSHSMNANTTFDSISHFISVLLPKKKISQNWYIKETTGATTIKENYSFFFCLFWNHNQIQRRHTQNCIKHIILLRAIEMQSFGKLFENYSF